MALPVILPTPLSLWRGDSRTLTFRFWADVNKTVPIDLTAYGSVFSAQVRLSPGDPLLAGLDVDASQVATGVLTVRFTPATWASIGRDVKAAGYDVQAASTAGDDVTTLVTQKLKVSGDYTHA
jgi:hypothetical protein